MTGATFAALGVGLITIGAGMGIGKLAAAAMEGIARQPEATKEIRQAMLLAAVLIEGVAVISIIVALLTIILK
ncbi:MAG: ATP synthase F0 subunit C [Candidatus Omnitrophica bacterium]|nr:ATP synthase F0 subunit C [Candidatus Omnitrophota bacterium]MCA9402423.1 ATP synthase F0 subunit C [Candidatus Omnitrophota bacterium]MCB9722125.1 ATP synthase F0 subunit C [Candidatus Omnitrophota bacterium]